MNASIACDICGHDEPHNHSPWDVERERYCRPAFEKSFEEHFLRSPIPPGLDPSGSYGWALYWKHRAKNGLTYYGMQQTQIAWEIWQVAWRERGKMFPEMVRACEYACGMNTPAPSGTAQQQDRPIEG